MPSRKNNKPKITGKSQKGQHVPDFTEDEARDYFESLRWPNGPACVHCGCTGEMVTRLQGKSARSGTFQCNGCRDQFTVTVGTIMEDSHLPLAIWAKAFHYLCSSKKGISALQLQRQLGLGSYRTAWFLSHRIREAMRCEPLAGMLRDEVQVDETYVGPSRHGKNAPEGAPPKKRGRGTDKQPVLALVQTGGRMHSKPIDRIDAKTLKAAMEECIDPNAKIVTDELRSYPKAAAGFSGGHATVNHGAGQYVAADGSNVNSCESWFALFKRGLHGAFHHVSRKHLHRYCDEFAFRWNGREQTDSERRNSAVCGGEGKRLFYSSPVNNKDAIS